MIKTALVTGGRGFVGRHMVKELAARGYRCTTWDLPRQDMLVRLDEIDPRTQFDLVVHCAYYVGGRRAIDGDKTALAYNLMLDSHLFNWAVATRQKHVLYFSSSAVYPTRLQHQAGHKLAEDDLKGEGYPDADYGWAKLTGERLAKNAIELGLPVTVVRPFSGYGEDQSEDYPFRAFVERAKAHVDPFMIWGNAAQVRDWIHIDDVVRGALAVVDYDRRQFHSELLGRTTIGPVNLCTGRGVSMLALAKTLTSCAGYDPEYGVDDQAPMGVFYRVGDPTKMQQFYQPRVTIEEGILRATA